MQTATTTAKHLIFRLGAETFGVDVMRVREIVGVQTVTAVPHAGHGVKGVINLRGKVVPIVDLRDTEAAPTAKTSLIVMKADESIVAMVVDEVIEVANAVDVARLFDVDAALGAKR